MSEALRVCLFNAEPRLPLRGAVEGVRGLALIGEVGSLEALHEHIKEGLVDLVLVNLDAEDALEVVERIAARTGGCGIIGVSSRTEPDRIIKATRAGCTQFVPWPIDPEDFRAAIDRVRGRRASPVRGSRRICVVGSSGGAGATTIACNLTMELAQLVGQDCAIIDLNLELGDVGGFFDCQPTYSVGDVCREGVEVDRVMMEKAFCRLDCQVSVLVRPQRLEEIYEVTTEGIANLLDQARQVYPFIVVDLPRSFSFISAAALGEAERVLIVTQLNVSSIRNATRIYECLCEMGAPPESVGIVLNRGKSPFGNITVEDVEAHFGRPVFAMIPNDYRCVQSSLDLGHAIMTDDPHNPVRLAIHDMARKIASDLLEDPAPAANSRGLLGLFWGRKSPARRMVAGQTRA